MKWFLIAALLGVAVLVLAACPKPPATYTLNVNVVPSDSGGRVARLPAPDAEGRYAAGTVVKLTASPPEDSQSWSFQGWNGDTQGSTPTAEIRMDSDKSVTARFKELPRPCGDGIVCVKLKDPGGSGVYAFDPHELVFRVGDTVIFNLSAESEFHTFTADDLGIDVSVDGGSTETFTFTFDKAGTYELTCIPHEALGMTGTITVR